VTEVARMRDSVFIENFDMLPFLVPHTHVVVLCDLATILLNRLLPGALQSTLF